MGILDPKPLTVAAGNATYARKGSIKLNVRDYGAKGDGAADDRPAIMAALDDAKNATGKNLAAVIYFPAGSYKVSADINIDASNIELQGDGESSILALNGAALNIDGRAGLVMFNGLRNLRVRRTGTAGVAVGVLGGGMGSGLYPCRWHMDNVHISSTAGTALRMAGTFLGTLYNVYLRNSSLGLLINNDDSAGNLAANAINFHGGEIQAVENAAQITNGIAVSFFGTTIEGSSVSGVDLISDNRGVSFNGCYIEANNSFDLRAGNSGNNMGVSVNGCYFNPGVYGPKDRAIVLINSRGTSLTGNYFYGYAKSPVQVAETANGMVTGLANDSNFNSVGGFPVVEVTAGRDWGRVTGQQESLDGSALAGDTRLDIAGRAGQQRIMRVLTGSKARWIAGGDATAETGSNAGSAFVLNAYDDAGAYLGQILSAYRNPLQLRVHNGLRVDGAISGTGFDVKVTKPAATEVTYFVTPRGNDANDGLSLATAKATIGSAITAAGASKPRIQLGVGSFTVAADIVYPEGMVLEGAGRGLTSLTYTGTGTMFAPTTPAVRTYNTIFRDLTLVGPGKTSTATGISLESVTDARLQGVTVRLFGTGIRISSTTNGGAVYNRFEQVIATSCGTGFKVDAAGSNSNLFTGCRANACTTGLDITDSNHNEWVAGSFEANTTGLKVTATANALADLNAVSFARFEGNTTAVDITSANVRDFSLLHPATFGTYTVNDLGTRTTQWGSQQTQPNKMSSTIQSDKGSWRFERTVNGGTELPAMSVVDGVTSTGTPVTLQVETERSAGVFARFKRGGAKYVDILASGDVEFFQPNTGPILRSANGTRYRLTVSDAGVVGATAL